MISKKILFSISLTIILLCTTVFGQSVQELQLLQRFLNQSNSLSLPDEKISNTIDTSQDDLIGKTTLTSPNLRHITKNGEWTSIKNYINWLNETDGDTSVMELYGFIPDTSLIYFGYNIFTQRDSLSLWQSIPAPDNYILGSGDQIEISVWGEAQLNDRYIVNRNGNIYVDKVGLIALDGQTVASAITIIENKFKQSFATLRGKYPSSYINISFDASKSINVHFVGEVNLPGIHLVHPFSSIITGLIQSGGVKNSGSLRKILVRRDDKIISEFDLYNYLINGNIENNVQLRENDIIVVPVRQSTVEVNGSVNRPAIYESIDSENISSIIAYAGGLKYTSTGQITVTRVQPLEQRVSSNAYIKHFLFNYDQINAVNVVDGDKIIVHSIDESSNEIKILGQVKREGTYKLTKDMDLLDLINLAGGLEDSIFVKTMYLEEVDLVRKMGDDKYNKTIKINLNEILNDSNSLDIKLHNEDLVIVRANNNFQSTNNVKIEGEVVRPGIYAIEDKNETLENIISRAGGFTERAFFEGLMVYRDTLNLIWDDLSFSLIGGDSIFVEQRPGAVEVTGEVYNPGLIKYTPGRSLKSYLNAAGGRNPDGSRKDILVIRPNGDVKPKRFLFSPKVKEGDTIIVNKKPERDPFSLNQFLRDFTSIAASAAMVYYVIENTN